MLLLIILSSIFAYVFYGVVWARIVHQDIIKRYSKFYEDSLECFLAFCLWPILMVGVGIYLGWRWIYKNFVDE